MDDKIRNVNDEAMANENLLHAYNKAMECVLDGDMPPALVVEQGAGVVERVDGIKYEIAIVARRIVDGE